MMAPSERPTLMFVSALALDPPFLRVAELIGRRGDIDVHVVAPDEYRVETIYHPSGGLSASTARPAASAVTMHYLPASRSDV